MTHTDNESLFVDGHVDLTYFLMKHPETPTWSSLENGPFTLKKVREAGVRLFSNALYCEDRFNGEGSLRRLEDILRFTLDRLNKIRIIKDGNDLEALKRTPDMVGALFLLENADALAGNISCIDRLTDSGVSIVGLTHVGKNRLADGNMVTHSEGITDEGREIIRALTDNGLLIDVAHLHSQCFWQLLKLTEAPIVSSHTGIRDVCNIPRNIDLDQAKEIFGRGGLVGITFNPEMLSLEGTANLDNIFMHLDALVQRFGPDGVGIGSDFLGFDKEAEGLEDITKISRLMDMMLAHGYGAEAVKNIMGLNWLRMYEKIFKGGVP